jgi:predicted MFS family arabinose efflux permease
MEIDATDRTGLTAERSIVPSYAWVILAVTMLAGICAPFSQFKVPPVMPVLMETFHIDLTSAGMLMSIFAITGLIVALPAGLILQRFGLKISGLAASGCLLVGSVLGATANGYSTLFASRLIEGIGMGLIAVIGSAAISAWFPANRRGLPMGIWATWVSLGSLLIYMIAPPLEASNGWQSVWWLAASLTGAAMVVFALFFRLPQDSLTDKHSVNLAAGMGKAIRQPGIWLLAIAFGCFNFAIIGVIATYFPTYLKAVQGFDLTGASQITSIKMIVVIITAPLIGWMVDRIGSPRRIMLFSFLALAGFMALPFSISGWMIPASMVLLGVLAGAIPTCTFASVPELVGQNAPAGIGMGVIMVGQNLGQLLGPVIFGWLVQSIGWTTAGLCTIPVLLIGFAAVRRIKMK